MSTTIQRGYSLPQDNFTIVPNTWLRDNRLTHKARGILFELMSHRPGWQTSVERLAELGPDGESAIKSGLKELEKCGYLTREWVRDGLGKRIGTSYTITDPASRQDVVDPSGENHLMENPQVSPSGENRPVENPQVDPPGENRPVENPPVGNRTHKKNNTKKKREEKEEKEGGLREQGTSPARALAVVPPLESNLENDLEERLIGPQAAASPEPDPSADTIPARAHSERAAASTGHAGLPPRSCPRHPDGTPDPCGSCKDARLAHDAAAQAQAQAVKVAKLQAEVDFFAATRLAAAECTYCDSIGKRHDAPFVECDHTPDQMERRRNGAARVRSALAAKQRTAN